VERARASAFVSPVCVLCVVFSFHCADGLILPSSESEWLETTWLLLNLAWMCTRAVDLTHWALARRTVKVRVTLVAPKFILCIRSCYVGCSAPVRCLVDLMKVGMPGRRKTAGNDPPILVRPSRVHAPRSFGTSPEIEMLAFLVRTGAGAVATS
jgi:hypothetical protein